MKSNIQTAVADQAELALARRGFGSPVDESVIFKLPSMTSAVRLAINVSGLEEKEVYLSLAIDAGHWTRIMKGDAHFPLDKLNPLCDLVNNEIPLQWWANSRGKGLHLLESEAARQLRVERELRQVAEEKLSYLESKMWGRQA